MSVEVMLTRAILEDQTSAALMKIGGGYDAVATKANRLNATGNVFLGMGAAALAFNAKALIVAGTLDQYSKTMEIAEKANKKAFDPRYIKEYGDQVQQYATKSYQTFMDLDRVSTKLTMSGMNVLRKTGSTVNPNADVESMMADIATGSGKGLDQVVRWFQMIQGGNAHSMGYALGVRGIGSIGISERDLYNAAGLKWDNPKNYNELASQGKDRLIEIIQRAMDAKGMTGIDQRLATTTLQGSSNMVKDNMTYLMGAIGKEDLGPAIHGLNELADKLHEITDFIKAHPMAGYIIQAIPFILLGIGAINKFEAAYIRLQSAALKSSTVQSESAARVAAANELAANRTAVAEDRAVIRYQAAGLSAERAAAQVSAADIAVQRAHLVVIAAEEQLQKVESDGWATASQLTAARERLSIAIQAEVLAQERLTIATRNAASADEVAERAQVNLATATENAATATNTLNENMATSGAVAGETGNAYALFGRKAMGAITPLIASLGKMYLYWAAIDGLRALSDEGTPGKISEDRYNEARSAEGGFGSFAGYSLMHPGDAVSAAIEAFKNPHPLANYLADAETTAANYGDTNPKKDFTELQKRVSLAPSNAGFAYDPSLMKAIDALVDKYRSPKGLGSLPGDIGGPSDGSDAGDSIDSKYKLPAQLSYNLDYYSKQIDYLEKAKAGYVKINEAKKEEIKWLERAHDLYMAQADLAKKAGETESYWALRTKANDEHMKAAELQHDKKKADWDDIVGKVIGARGLSTADILRDTGIGPHSFATISKPSVSPMHQLTAALIKMSQRPINANLYMDNKHVGSMKAEITDHVVGELAPLLAGVWADTGAGGIN